MRFIVPLAILSVSVAATETEAPVAATEVGYVLEDSNSRAAEYKKIYDAESAVYSAWLEALAPGPPRAGGKWRGKTAVGVSTAVLALTAIQAARDDKKCRDQAEEERGIWCRFVVGANNVFSRR
jgi:hypothetical protein